MKKITLSVILLSTAGLLHAQSSTENYVQTKTYIDYPSGQAAKTAVSVQYFDGLGRPKQTVNVKASPASKDVVSHVVYDAFGRVANEYLPVPQEITQNGNIYGTPLANASNGAIYGTEKIYSEKILEASPLDRVLQQKQPGNAWNDKPITFEYGTNTAGDVKKYSTTNAWVNTATSFTTVVSTDYPAGQLYKNLVTDEDGNKTTEYKNMQGQVILVRKAVSASENADTYYVYNEYDHLVLVVPPKANIAPNINDVLDTLCYRYQYDGRNRLVSKKLPGKGWEYMVYDKQDRMVMTQDANLGAAQQWMFMKYDPFGRVVYSGIYTGTAEYGMAGRLAEQNNVEAKGSNNELRGSSSIPNSGAESLNYSNTAYPTSSIKIMTVNYYDSFPRDPWFPNDLPGVILDQKVILNSQSGYAKGMLLVSYVRNIENESWTRNFMLYDTKGRLIGSRSLNHLGGYTKTESELNFAGSPKRTVTSHKRLRFDAERVITETFTYDHQSRLLVHKHQVDTNPEEILAQNEYNELSQLKTKKVGGIVPTSPLQTIDYKYNIRGWMTQINDPVTLNGKLFGYKIKYNNPEYASVAPGRFNGNIAEIDWNMSTVNNIKRYNYSYDRLNRLTDAEYAEPETTNPNNNNFDERLTYDINGNIATLKRNAPVGGAPTTPVVVDNLEYQYTGNRLDKVIETAWNDMGYEGGNHTIDYDQNGNMTTMKDKGIQDIVYNYLSLPNKMSIDQSSPFGAISKFELNYLYRADGVKIRKTYSSQSGRGGGIIKNRTIDYLDGFQYSIDELAPICTWCRTDFAYEQQAYKMDPMPIEVLPGNPIGGMWILDFVPTAEGFYSFKENRYIYQYRDHLGNARVSFAKNSAGALEITDTNNYYPFGLNHIGGDTGGQLGSYKNYKYNGKELQETGMFDYGARFYMPDLGRWGVVDPLAEKYQPMSTYHMSGNNPIFYVDSNGMNYDDYGADNNGNITLIQKTEDNFDRLYVAKSGSDGNAELDSKGNAQKVISGEGKENKDYVKVNKESKDSGTIISQLSGKDSNGLSHGTTNNFTDARKVFQFAADKSRVEWTIGGFRTGGGKQFLVGTSHLMDKTTAAWDFGEKGLNYENNIYSGHTHPYSRYPQQHDLKLSNPNAYNFLYYTGVGNGARESYFMPFNITPGKNGELNWTLKNGYGSVKLPDLIK